jgi:hypothetical protein
VGAPAVGEAELPEFCGGAVVVVDRLIHGRGVDLAGAVAADRCPEVAEQFGQLRLVAGADPFTQRAVRLSRPRWDGTVFQPAPAAGRGSPAVPDAGAQINLLLRTADYKLTFSGDYGVAD